MYVLYIYILYYVILCYIILYYIILYMTYHIHHISFYNVTRHATTWKIPFLKQGPRSLCPSPSHAWVSRPTSPAGHRKSEPNRLANLTNRPDGQSLSGSIRAWWLGHPGMIQKGRQQFLWDITDITQQPTMIFCEIPEVDGQCEWENHRNI